MKKIGKIIRISLIVSFVLFFSVPFYIVFLNNHVTKAYYVNKIEQQIEALEKSGTAGDDYATDLYNIEINSIEGKEYILSILKNSESNESYSIFRSTRPRESYYIHMDDIDITFFYDNESDHKKANIVLFGFHTNEYHIFDEKTYLYQYLMSFFEISEPGLIFLQ
ncbi:MAG: hypothetical protein LBS21_15520 [Clostridiales bacterium]|jgi:hypothetical protein|nr:hypothetical protein [Clostridiales bacterium]